MAEEPGLSTEEKTEAAWTLGMGGGVYGAYNAGLHKPISYTFFSLGLKRKFGERLSLGSDFTAEIDNVGPSGDVLSVVCAAYSPLKRVSMNAFAGPLYQPGIDEDPAFWATLIGGGINIPTKRGPVFGAWVILNDRIGEEEREVIAGLQISYEITGLASW